MTFNGPDPACYVRRRATLREKLEGAVLYIPELPESVYSNDVHYPYRPDTDIRYLCGFEEPAALIIAAHGGEEDGFSLLVNPRDEASETWTGLRVGLEGACERYLADYSHPLAEAEAVLLGHLRKASTLYYAYSRNAATNLRVTELVRRANAERPRSGLASLPVADARELLGEMRLHKSDEEIAQMRSAAAASVPAHRRLMETLRPGMHEYEVQALVDFGFRSAGCAGPAYPTIAAGGENATVLHYTRNDRVLRDGELLLTDAGGEWGGYCADITRTIPVGKRYSKPQAALYDLVLAAQSAALEQLEPGATVAAVHEAAVAVLCAGLCDLGLLPGKPEDRVADESYKRFYMHNTSHWLGMDVHDTGAYRAEGDSRCLEPGMVLTVEPGLYVRADAEGVDASYRGIGIRIEDDVAVTAGGHEVLTAALPKRRSEIEALR